MVEKIEGFAIELGLDTIKIDTGLKDMKSKLSLVNSEMKANMSAFDRGEKSVKKYETQLTGLNKKLEVQRDVTTKAQTAYEKMVIEHGEGSVEAEKAARAYNEEAAQLNNLQRYVDGVTEDMKKLSEEQKVAASGFAKFGDKMQDVGGKMTAVGDKMKGIGKSMSMYVTAPLVGFSALAAKTGIDFDDSMAKVQAVSGATGKDLDSLRDKAKEMGAKTKFSASESADALNYMAMAGWKTNDMLDGLEGVMDLAAASGEDLGIVSDIVTDGLTAFGLTAKDSGRFADVLAAASANANTNVGMLGKSFEYAAPVAGALGYSVEDTAVALGLMANAGIKADKGGTALRSMLTNLVTPTEKMSTIMDILGISLTDAEGNMKDLDEIMADLRKGFNGLTEEQQASYAAQLFGKEAMSGALAVINASEADYNKLTKAVAGSTGAAKEMAGIMEGKLGGTIREIKSGLEGFAISIYEQMLPSLEKVAAKVKGFVGWLNDLSPAAKNTVVVIGAVAASIGPLLFGLGAITAILGTVFTFVGSVSSAIAIMGTGVAAATPLIGGLATTFTVLTGPVGLALAGIAGLTVAGIGLYNHLKKDAIPEVDRFGNGVSDATKKALGGFFELSDGAGQALADMSINSKIVTQEMADSLSGKFKKMNEEILSGMKKRHADQIEDMEKFFLNSSALSDEREQEILRKQKVQNQARETEQKHAEERIQQILQGAVDQKRELTQSEKDQINAIQQSMNENAVQYLTDNERDQKVILENMKNQASDLSARQAAEVVKNSAKSRDKVIADADKTYNDTVAFAIKQRDETGTMSTEEADAVIKEAKKKRDESVKHAQNTHKDVVKEAKGQAAEHVNEVNWETGEILSKWEKYKKDVGQRVRDSSKEIKDTFSGMWKSVQEKTEQGKESVKGKMKELGLSIGKSVINTKNDAIAKYEEIRSGLISKAENMRKNVAGKFVGVYTSIKKTLGDTRDKATEIFASIVKGATQLPGKMRDGIVKMASNAVSGIKTVGKKMADKFGSVVNGLIDGLNTITGRIGIKANIDRWTVPKFANGTDGHKGGLMVVGDKYGRELVELPNGKTFLSPDQDTLLNAPKGTRVIPNRITEKYLNGDIPHYSGGTGVTSWLKDKAKSFTSAMSSVWEYMKSPSKLLNLIPLPKIEGLSGGMATMAKGAVGVVKDKALEYIKNAFSKSGELGSKGGFPAPFRLTSRAGMRIHPILKTPMFHYGDDWGAPSGTPIPSKSAGQVISSGFHSIRGNFVKVKSGPYEMIYQHNSKNRVHTGDSVKPGQIIGNVGSTGRSTGPHLHFETWKNGKFVAPKSLGFASGGEVNVPGMYNLAEDGYGEWVISKDPKRRTDSMKLLALAAKSITSKGSGNKRPHQLPGGTSGSGVFEQMLAALLEQTQLHSEQIALLTQLLAKDSNLYIGRKEMQEMADPLNDIMRNNQQRRGKFATT